MSVLFRPYFRHDKDDACIAIDVGKAPRRANADAAFVVAVLLRQIIITSGEAFLVNEAHFIISPDGIIFKLATTGNFHSGRSSSSMGNRGIFSL